MRSFTTQPSATTSHTSALLASQDSSWIIDFGASSYMFGTRDLFIRSIAIADRRHYLVSGEGVIHTSPQITLDRILYVVDFLVNLLSISVVIKALYCSVTFFSFHCIFQDL